MSQHDDIVAFLSGWLSAHPEFGVEDGAVAWHAFRPPGWQTLPSLEGLAAELVGTSEFRALKLGSWLGSTDGQVIEQALHVVIPPAFKPQYELVLGGLRLAAKLQRQHGTRVAGRVALGVIGVGTVLTVVASDSRRVSLFAALSRPLGSGIPGQ